MFSTTHISFRLQYTVLCETPSKGNENLLYVLHNTIHNLAWLLSCDISVMLTELWPVDNAAISSGDVSGVLKLTVLTRCGITPWRCKKNTLYFLVRDIVHSFMQLAGLAFLGLMPESKVSSICVGGAEKVIALKCTRKS